MADTGPVPMAEDRDVRAISSLLSLRVPQRESLQLLSHWVNAIRVAKGQDLDAALTATKAMLAENAGLSQHVRTDFSAFERAFPNLCFSLATGVGKTRLMGAFIAWLSRHLGCRHFLVIAPNLTIYDKLRADLGDPSCPKYVFNLPEFATDPPELITGDNYESGRGVRDDLRRDPQLPYMAREGRVHINVFNISKLSKDAKSTGGQVPRIKRLQEYIGTSYFDYLAGLDDLVLILDEAHRYRAEAGLQVLNELKPLLGLELTATPFLVSGKKEVWFQNVVYDYPLGAAMEDELVKEPTVVYRSNLDTSQLSDENLEKLKLSDGVAVHEETKGYLDTYAQAHGLHRVKPFMLVVASDTKHADQLKILLESDAFAGGVYKGKVAVVHSNQGGEEKEENVQRLLAVESADEPTEIVIHVDKLKEGWDVTNLYTLVPLRAANSPQLVLQSMGRGLRLPYGKRTRDPNVDGLNIISHDRYRDLLNAAKEPGSRLTTTSIHERDLDEVKAEPTEAVPVQHSGLSLPAILDKVLPATEGDLPTKERTAEVNDFVQQAVYSTQSLLGHIAKITRLPDLRNTDAKMRLATLVAADLAQTRPVQTALPLAQMPAISSIVDEVIEQLLAVAIEVPNVQIVPSADLHFEYAPFDLDTRNLPRWQPIARDIVFQNLRDQETTHLLRPGTLTHTEPRPENYIVRGLVDYNDIDYEQCRALLYRLAGQFVQHVKTYLHDDELVTDVLHFHQEDAARIVRTALVQHRRKVATTWEPFVSPSYGLLQQVTLTAVKGLPLLSLKQQPPRKSEIKKYIFGPCKRGVWEKCKFESDPERVFAAIVDDDPGVMRWMRPPLGVPKIEWTREGDDRLYRPDFIVETPTVKLLCEVKADNQIDTDEVRAKANAGEQWCETASKHDTKPWRYLLLRESWVLPNFNLAGLAASAGLNINVHFQQQGRHAGVPVDIPRC